MYLMNARMALLVLGVALGGTVAMVECQELDRDGALKLNQIQLIGTHNSYHAGIPPSEGRLWKIRALSAWEGLDYKHESLTQQLDSGGTADGGRSASSARSAV
jgi:hypothetical protein